MTNKEFYTAVINANISAELTEKATALLNSAEKKNNKRAEEQDLNRLANIKLARAIAKSMMSNTTYAASEIVTLMADTEKLSTAKVSAVAKVGVEEGIFTAVSGYKVGGKGRAVKGYCVTESYLAEIATELADEEELDELMDEDGDEDETEDEE